VNWESVQAAPPSLIMPWRSTSFDTRRPARIRSPQESFRRAPACWRPPAPHQERDDHCCDLVQVLRSRPVHRIAGIGRRPVIEGALPSARAATGPGRTPDPEADDRDQRSASSGPMRRWRRHSLRQRLSVRAHRARRSYALWAPGLPTRVGQAEQAAPAGSPTNLCECGPGPQPLSESGWSPSSISADWYSVSDGAAVSACAGMT
jgi:hypothetical protein